MILLPSVSTWMSQRNLKLNMLKNRVSIFFPCPQSYFPFSANDRTSIWSPKSHSEHPSFVPHQTLSPDNSTPSASLPLLLHPAGSWQAPNRSPCFWTHFPFPPYQGSAFFFSIKGQVVNMFGPVGPMVSITATQCCRCNGKTA